MKNIILCSDGTGNSGDRVNSTNVFKLYKTVDIENTNQLVYYSDGIGSTGNKYLKIISGALGFGFKSNVMKLYGYLVKHYEPGDKVYMFGFSRGAATMRVMAGMVEVLGLMRKDCDDITTGGRVDSIKLKIKLYKLMRLYKRSSLHANRIKKFKEEQTHGVIDIEMVGVWDTVSALGFPQDSSWFVIGLSKLAEKIVDIVSPHSLFNYQLNSNVKNAYHALAIDDDRYTFHPKVWDETLENRPVNIEQVWFAGAHANVGGGYPRTGLSSIALDWMIERAKDNGVIFNEGMCEDIRADMNTAGKIYDPRAGIFAYYRFSPRHIRDLCRYKGKSILRGDIRIHKSVLERIHQRTYTPILPNRFKIVETDSNTRSILYLENEDEARVLKDRINLLIKIRTWLYHIFTEFSLIIGIMMWYLTMYKDYPAVESEMYNSAIALIPLPDNFIYYCTHVNPWLGLTFVCVSLILFVSYKVFRILNERIRKRINWWLHGTIEK